MNNTIGKRELIHGAYYKGVCRNATVARWDGSRQVFVHWRQKWGIKFTEAIPHESDQYRHYDVFYASDIILKQPAEEIPLDQDTGLPYQLK